MSIVLSHTFIKIHDEPNYKPIKKIKDELKTNATTVNKELGGGAHGHLGLALISQENSRTSNPSYE